MLLNTLLAWLRVQTVQERLRVDKDNVNFEIALTLSTLSRSCADCTLRKIREFNNLICIYNIKR